MEQQSRFPGTKCQTETPNMARPEFAQLFGPVQDAG